MKYKKLRGKLREHDLLGSDVGEAIGVCGMSVSNRMTGRTQWKLDEMYTVMDMLDIPYSQMHLYFPKDGRTVDETERGARYGRRAGRAPARGEAGI